jgi:hypothetical protein
MEADYDLEVSDDGLELLVRALELYTYTLASKSGICGTESLQTA